MSDKIEIITCEFYVNGMHCNACEVFIEQELIKHQSIKKVKANLITEIVQIETTDELNLDEINQNIREYGYVLAHEKQLHPKTNFKELAIAFGIALLFFSGFLLLQKAGIINLLNADKISYPFIFLVGVVASLSSCMAVVGGLVLTISSSYTKNAAKNKTVPMILFHLARLIGFFILGGLIGILGKAFTLTPMLTFLMSTILFFTMFGIGISLLEIFPQLKRAQLIMPKNIFNSLINRNKLTNQFAPILLGIITFFLPCGFTQSMQIYALSTGTFINGALTMFVFALGTFPVLALISFLASSISQKFKSGLFFKVAGFIIIFFAVLNFIGGLTSIGLIQPILNF